MTDPASLSPSALGEAVMRALGWTAVGAFGGEVLWFAPDGDPGPDAPLDFHGHDKWRAFGVVVEACEREGCVRVECGDIQFQNDAGETLGCETWEDGSDWPRALAVAFLRARAGEGR